MANRQHGASPAEAPQAAALRAERAYVAALYARLDADRARAEDTLRRLESRGSAGGTRQARTERDISAAELARTIARLNGVDSGLCFGRVDTEDGTTLYIGRAGLRDATYQPLLVDWRAPAAHPFYAASPGDPHALVRRRHLHTRGREITGLDDEVFDLDLIGEDARALVGEAALLASLRRGRTGRMSDVVATIQAEQDRVIRSGLPGILVVQGGPGTGKTVAALHRAAYLLYAHRKTLERRGVLVIGPNDTFLRYIGQVLPSLGETEVATTALGGLFPGVHATEADSAETAVVKGSPRMVEVIEAAVRNLQRDPGGDIRVPVEGVELRLTRGQCLRARDRARALGMPHNMARKRFVTDLLDALVRDQAARLERPLDDEELRHGPAELWRQPSVRAAIDALWPELAPTGLIRELLGDADQLRAATTGLTEAERATLFRPLDAPWTVEDVPLLDEAAELLGADDSAERARARTAEARRADEEEYALGVLRITGLEDQLDPAVLAAFHRDPAPYRTTAERAQADRSWAYGHVIVDEAQELSPMAWRMVMRRIPSRSMTVVGDVAQTGSAAGARSWGEMLDPYAKGRWRQVELTVNYRTPSEVMAVAADILAAVAPGQRAPESVRGEGTGPRAVAAPDGALAAAVADAVAAELAALEADGGGRLAVIAADRRLPSLTAALPRAATGTHRAALDSDVVLLTTRQAKGLEFDRVVLADPAGILAQSPKGGHDLYVAVTRVTRQLTVVHEGELPEVLSGPVR
ncbi:HelD family protein [Streptomyces sp. RPT161]|uniref:HelD family protein n=1 Tax=Streptomyces sp. RPT161 TaxID=3015993 RepID=UPI0022B9336F|nr:AAA family ATPase [Streptomyces sp. RPT161]